MEAMKMSPVGQFDTLCDRMQHKWAYIFCMGIYIWLI